MARQSWAPRSAAFLFAACAGAAALLFVFFGVHYYKVIIHNYSLPPQKENIGEDTAKRVPLDKRVYFIPDILTNEMMWLGATTFIITVLCIWFYHAPLENHADPQVTPLGTTAPWYFLWIQGALKLGDKFIWGVAFPTVALGGLAMFALPGCDAEPALRASPLHADDRHAADLGHDHLELYGLGQIRGQDFVRNRNCARTDIRAGA